MAPLPARPQARQAGVVRLHSRLPHAITRADPAGHHAMQLPQKPTPRVFSGMQPSGSLHLGNYLGAMVQWVAMQTTHECIYCVVDMHAITVAQDPKELRQSIRAVTAAYMAAGVDPRKTILFSQSQVHEQIGRASCRG